MRQYRYALRLTTHPVAVSLPIFERTDRGAFDALSCGVALAAAQVGSSRGRAPVRSFAVNPGRLPRPGNARSSDPH
jgi:hypothetical protein